MTMRRIGVVQDVPNSDKRKAREQRGAAEREVEQATLAAIRPVLRRETATAWFDAAYAERAKRELDRLGAQIELQRETLAPAITAGRASAADAFMLGGALEGVRERLIEQDRAIAKARAQLAAFVRSAASAPLGEAPDTAQLPQARERLLAELHAHPELAAYHERIRLARSEVALERTTKIPDWNVELLYGWRSPAFSNMVTVMFSIDLPIAPGRRQDRDIAARVAELEQAEAMAEEARRMHEAEVRTALADWDAAVARLGRYDTRILPLARDRASAALAAYRGGSGSLSGVIEASRAETEAQLARLGAEAERARAWARLAYLFPLGRSNEPHRPLSRRNGRRGTRRRWRRLLARDVADACDARGRFGAGRGATSGPESPLLVRPDVSAAAVRQARQVALHGYAARAEVRRRGRRRGDREHQPTRCPEPRHPHRRGAARVARAQADRGGERRLERALGRARPAACRRIHREAARARAARCGARRRCRWSRSCFPNGPRRRRSSCCCDGSPRPMARRSGTRRASGSCCWA